MEHIELSDIQGDKSIENQSISLLSSLSLSADSVKSAINKVIDSDNQKMPLSGGEISGDLGVTGSISCVGYLQTDATGYMQNYCSRGGHLETSKGKYTDFRPLGVSFYKPSKVGGCVGALGYCMLSGCNDPETGNGVLKLSGDAAPLKEAVKQLSTKTGQFKWSIAIDTESDGYAYNIDPEKIEDVYADDGKTISATIVGLKQPIAEGTLSKFKSTEAEMLALWENQVENEDDNCFYCPTVPEAGNQLVPVFYGAHAEGCMSRAMQRGSHAEGRMTLADGRYSHAEGMDTIAVGIAAHSEGTWTTAMGKGAHAEGLRTQSLGTQSHAEGNETKANGSFAHSEGNITHATGVASHAEGGDTHAEGDLSHAEGASTYATGRAAHSEGKQTSARGECAYAGGVKSEANGACSFARGEECFAWADNSTVFGYKAQANGKRVFCWNGSTEAYGANVDGEGTFLVNPLKGVNGFYIGTQSLSAIISSAIDAALKAKGL